MVDELSAMEPTYEGDAVSDESPSLQTMKIY